MLLNLWTLTDVAFDVIQAREYHDYSISGIENCTSEITTTNENFANSNATLLKPRMVSSIYFWASFSTFVFPPILGVFIFYCVHGKYGIFGDPSKPQLFKHKRRIASTPFIIRFCLLVFLIPALTIIRAFMGYYIFLPFCTLFFSAKLMIYGQLKTTERIDIVGMDMYFTPALLPFFTLVEQLAEAGPQMAIAILFLINNYHCGELYTYDLIGTALPQIIISLIFSFGSFLIGTIKGIVAGVKTVNAVRKEKLALKHEKLAKSQMLE